MSDDVKMVIVVRNDLNMRKGKMVAQGAHAATHFLLEKVQRGQKFTATEKAWLESGTTKICVRAESEDELLDIYGKAKVAGLTVHLVTDAGRTEFKEPTRTCLSIGPNKASEIDQITGSLKLL